MIPGQARKLVPAKKLSGIAKIVVLTIVFLMTVTSSAIIFWFVDQLYLGGRYFNLI